ncbi:hypothetical protein BASA60_011459 [Batrachochytrium salamandrivorans]|nr:hypothetical protein BASA60_011459 [Batrachochytrium salamandrivorans]KAH9256811.1 hypothetical protein BASA81_004914 [Batrachochytrium salamandrivorans]KAH9268485.1 hypothetical protein BASA83_009328 [Batrachochytrium salamandrivorans]
MKVSVLVAAAMVITSVSASGKGGLGGLFKKGSGMTGSESAWNLLDKNPESEPSQESPIRGVGQRLLQSSLARKLRSGSSRNSPKHKPRPGPSQDSLAHGSRPVFPQKRPVHDSAPIQVPEPRKKDPVCDPIVEELYISRDKICDFDAAFSRLIPDFYKLMRRQSDKEFNNMMKMRMAKLMKEYGVVGTSGDDVIKGNDEKEEEEKDEEEEERKASALRAEAMQKWIESHPKAISDLESIKAKYISLEKDHGEIWARLLSSNCPTEKVKHFSLEYMKQSEYFPEWYSETNLISLDEQ